MLSRTAADETAATALQREALVLRRVAHPNVIEVADLVATADGLRLRFVPVDAGPLPEGTDTDIRQTAAFLGATAATVAHLHDLGVAHGGLDAQTVLLRADGRPLLHGFASAGPASDAGVANATSVTIRT